MYKNSFDKKIDNCQNVFSSLNNSRNDDSREVIINRGGYDSISIDKKINDIFNSSNYIYKADVKILTDKGLINKRIVARNRNNLITMDNEYIPISIIRDIYK